MLNSRNWRNDTPLHRIARGESPLFDVELILARFVLVAVFATLRITEGVDVTKWGPECDSLNAQARAAVSYASSVMRRVVGATNNYLQTPMLVALGERNLALARLLESFGGNVLVNHPNVSDLADEKLSPEILPVAHKTSATMQNMIRMWTRGGSLHSASGRSPVCHETHEGPCK
jgi:hypothetical protein